VISCVRHWPARLSSAGVFELLAGAVLLTALGAGAGERSSVPSFLLQSWDMDDGLPSTRINAAAHTSDGYLWLAMPNGLARFDGARFAVFDAASSPPLKDAYARSLLVTRDGHLLIGTYHGALLQRNHDGFQTLVGPEVTRGRQILTLLEDAQSNLWLGTDEAGLICWQAGVARYFTQTNGLPGLHVEQLTADTNGQIHFFCNGKLCVLESNRCRLVERPAWVPASVTAITPARQGGLWVATSQSYYNGTRIFRLQNGQWSEPESHYPWPQEYSRSRTYTLLEDQAGRLWCATAGRGIFFWTAKQGWQALDTRFPLSHADGLCLKETEDGVIWLGTRTTGLRMIRPGPPVTSLHLPAEFEQNVLACLCVRRDGSIWGGTDGAGLLAWRDGEPVHYGLEQGLPQLQVNAILEDARSNLLVATSGGLIRLVEDHFEPTGDSTLLRHTVTALFQDRKQNLWAGTGAGLVQMTGDGRSLGFFGRTNGLPNGLVRCVAEDETGAIWTVISGIGVFRQEGDRFSKLQPWENAEDYTQSWDDGITVHSLLLAGDGSLWAASVGNGLARLPGKNFARWNYEEDGLPSSMLFSVLQDDEDNLWCSSENGLFGIPKQKLLAYQRGRSPRLIAWRLTTADGLASKACSGFGQGAAAKGADGRLWFADGPALAVVDPASTPHDTKIYAPFVEGITADGQPAKFSTDGALRIVSGVRSIEIHYTSPNLLSPDRLRFRYLLENLDKNWVEAGNRRTAYYNRLPPGNYQFKLMVSGQEENWLAMAKAIRVEIMPRFYERRSVQAAGVLAALAAVGLAVWRIERARQRRRIERLKLQRAMDAERQRIARDIHDDLGAGLTEIILLSDTLREDIPHESTANQTAGKISTSARSLTRAMDEVVWAVNPGNDTLESFLNYLNDYAQEYLARSKVRFRWEAPIDVPALALSAETRHNLYLVCKEALHNAAKHAAASEVKIQMQSLPGGFRLTITDNGLGFALDAPRRRGNGLNNMQQRMAALGGRCEIHSATGAGTRLDLRLENLTVQQEKIS